jgi:hypothetical protein
MWKTSLQRRFWLIGYFIEWLIGGLLIIAPLATSISFGEILHLLKDYFAMTQLHLHFPLIVRFSLVDTSPPKVELRAVYNPCFLCIKVSKL